MNLTISKAKLPADASALATLDAKIFSSADAFNEEAWREMEAYWVKMDNVAIGNVAFIRESDIWDPWNSRHSLPGSLYVISTGLLPHYQHSGLGSVLKAWQIAYARYHKFDRMVTNARASNVASIGLNEKFGFQRIREIPNYYENPVETAVVLELILKRP